MELLIDYRAPGTNNTIERRLEMPYLACLWHIAIAAQKYRPSIYKFTRTLGHFFIYSDYLQRGTYNNNRFSVPSHYFYDSTIKSQFSNIVGKGIADYLAKQLNNVINTQSFEAVMKENGLPVHGSRPDLYGITRNDETIAIECKGWSNRSVSQADMNDVKNQSRAQQQVLPVTFSVASVSYNLYNRVKVKYYDPPNERSEHDEEFIIPLLTQYYDGVFEYLNKELFDVDDVFINDTRYYKINIGSMISNSSYYKYSKKYLNKYSMLIDTELEGVGNDILNVLKERKNEIKFDDATYIDNDGLGLTIKQ